MTYHQISYHCSCLPNQTMGSPIIPSPFQEFTQRLSLSHSEAFRFDALYFLRKRQAWVGGPFPIIINIVFMPLSHQLAVLSKLECPQVTASFYLEKLKLNNAVGTADGLKTKYNYLQQSIKRGLSGWRILIICSPWEKLSHARGRTRSLDSRPWSLPSSHFAIIVAD